MNAKLPIVLSTIGFRPAAGLRQYHDVLMTPELAASLLDDPKRPPNRKVNPQHAAYLASEMKSDRYVPELRVVALDEVDGKLIDGQHFCTAVRQSQKSSPCRVIMIPRKEADRIDGGKSRSGGQQDQLAGMDPKLASVLSETLNVLPQMEYGQYFQLHPREREILIQKLGREHVKTVALRRRLPVQAKAAAIFCRVFGAAQVDQIVEENFLDNTENGKRFKELSANLKRFGTPFGNYQTRCQMMTWAYIDAIKYLLPKENGGDGRRVLPHGEPPTGGFSGVRPTEQQRDRIFDFYSKVEKAYDWAVARRSHFNFSSKFFTQDPDTRLWRVKEANEK